MQHAVRPSVLGIGVHATTPNNELFIELRRIL